MGGIPMCVVCHTRPADPDWRPFCSERCGTEDLARWVDGRYRIASDVDVVPSPDTDEEQD